MRIGINLIALPSEKGSGAFRYIQMLLQAMGDYDIPQCEFIVYKQEQISEAYLGIPESLHVRYVNVPAIGSGLKRIIFEQTTFLRYLEPMDVLYSYCTSLPLLARCKKMFTLHDVYYLTTKQRYGWMQRTYLTLVTRIYCTLCDRVITVSQYSMGEIEKYLQVPRKKLALTYNFVLPTTSSLSKPEELFDSENTAVDLNKPFFFYVGNIQPGKNIKGMIEGFTRYADTRTDIQLIIAGKPTTYGDQMLSYIHNTHNIHYVGYQSREVIDWLLANCKAVVLLSFCEGFGIPPIEGFQFGRPALTSNTTSLPEVVGMAGVKVDPYDTEAIANGFKEIESNSKAYTPHIQDQLSKFSAKESVETFMSTLCITKYTRNK